jgi:hypothetical protein
VGYAILYANWLICDVVWLALLQLPVIFKYWLVTALVLLASDSRILSVRSTDTPSNGVVVTPDRSGATANGSSLYSPEGRSLRLYSSSTLSMLKVPHIFFYRAFFTSKNISRIA